MRRYLSIAVGVMLLGGVVLGQAPPTTPPMTAPKPDPKLAAATLQRARDMSDRRQFKEALEVFKLAASQGSFDAEEALGYCYEHGQGTVPNRVEAIRWYTLAARHGSPTAGNGLGALYSQSEPTDYVEGRKWFKAGADRGDAMAANNYAMMLELGKGGSIDLPGAVSYHIIAARSGNRESQYRAVCLSPSVRDAMVDLYNQFNLASATLSGIDFKVRTFGITGFELRTLPDVKQFVALVTFAMLGRIKDDDDKFFMGGKNTMDMRLTSLGGTQYELEMKDSIRGLDGVVHRFSKRATGPEWVLPASKGN